MNKINYPVILSVIFAILYLPHVFIMVNDINLILAYEVDPGSIIDSIQKMYSREFYSMLNGYHSRYYGWTYNAINFWLLLPIKIWMIIFDVKSYFIFYLTIKIIYFIIGLLSVIMLYTVSKSINLGNGLPAFIVSLIYITMPNSRQFYFIHPETTGALFTLVAFFFLKKFYDLGDVGKFKIGFVALFLACLSKQIFFFSSIPLIFAFYFIGIVKYKYSFLRLIIISSVIGFITFLFIHPYAFIHPLKFIEYQKSLSTSMAGVGYIPWLESIERWGIVMFEQGIIILPLLLSPIVALFAFYNYKKNNSFESLAIIICIAAFIITSCIVSFGNRTTFGPHYLFPAIIYLLLTLSYLINLIINYKFFSYSIRYILIAFISIIIVASYFYQSFPKSVFRLDFKKSTAFISYQYLENNLLQGDRVAHDHKIAVPGNAGFTSCHFWQGCGEKLKLESFDPDYIIFEEYSRLSGISQNEYKTLIDYIDNNNFKLVKEISIDPAINILNGQFISNQKATTIFIYKK